MAALNDLKHSLGAVRELVNLESIYDDPPSLADRDAAFGLRGAATVLTLACFEAFLSTVFQEELDRIVSAKMPLHLYDEKLRVEAIFSSLELAIKGDHATRGQNRSMRVSNVVAAARAVALDSFVPRALATTRSNPDSDTVKRLFSAIGRSSIFDNIAEFELRWGAPVASTFCADTLDALVISRNQIAHTADAAHVTRGDLSTNVRFVEVMAETLSAELTRHVSALIARATNAYAAGP